LATCQKFKQGTSKVYVWSSTVTPVCSVVGRCVCMHHFKCGLRFYKEDLGQETCCWTLNWERKCNLGKDTGL